MNFLKTYQLDPTITDLKKTRYGVTKDGGYVVVDNLTYDAYVSCGIGDEVSFDIDFLRKNTSIPAFAVDGTVNRPQNLPLNMYFIRKNIGPENNDSCTNLVNEIEPYQNIFLKMDIEGGEWSWLCKNSPIILPKCKQVVIEVHGLIDDSWCGSVQEKLTSLELFAKTHYLVHIHGNNHGPMSYYENVPIPLVSELTYIRKDVFPNELTLNTHPFPVMGLDYPNNPQTPDLIINSWPFVNTV